MRARLVPAITAVSGSEHLQPAVHLDLWGLVFGLWVEEVVVWGWVVSLLEAGVDCGPVRRPCCLVVSPADAEGFPSA